MKTKERWQEVGLPHVLKRLSKRIQLILTNIDLDLENIEIPPTGVFIHGSVGSGKTILASRILLKIHQQYFMEGKVLGWKMITAPELFFRIKACFDKQHEGENETEIVYSFSTCDLLILDDLGAEKESGWALTILYLIINRRYEEMRPTIFTSNFNLKELAEHLGDDRIPSRIFSMSKIIELQNTDRRLS